VNPLIVVLDDSPTILATAEVALAALGEVATTTLWSQAAAWILEASRDRARQVSLVCDLQMPGIHGGDFCRIVRRHTPGVGVVAFTSAPEQAPDGLFAVVRKDDGFGELRATLREFLARRAPVPAARGA